MTRLPALLAALGLAVGTIAAAPATAQTVTRTVTTTTRGDPVHGYHHGGYGYHHGYDHRGYGRRGGRFCRTMWHRHRQITKCTYR